MAVPWMAVSHHVPDSFVPFFCFSSWPRHRSVHLPQRVLRLHVSLTLSLPSSAADVCRSDTPPPSLSGVDTPACVYSLRLGRGTVRVQGRVDDLWVWWLLPLRGRLRPLMLFMGTVCPIAKCGHRGAKHKADCGEKRHASLASLARLPSPTSTPPSSADTFTRRRVDVSAPLH